MKKFFAAAIAAIFGLIAPSAKSAAPTTVKHPDWSQNAVIYEVNLRQFTPEGTLQAFARQLPRLKQLGVDILWFMPVHPISEVNRKGTLGSYYAVRDYRAINPEFGTLDDFRFVTETAHDLGMKVIIDWVPNHTGCDNAWVKEHPEYYARNDKGEMFGPFDWTDVYKLDYSNPATRRAMTDALIFWLKDMGIDGFRCDVAGQVPVDYWDEATAELRAIRPDMFMLAEASEPPLQANAFDMGYNWPMKDLFSAIAATSGQYTFAKEGEKPRNFPEKHAADIARLVAQQDEEYPSGTIMMNMITNHDLNSWEGTEFERLGRLADAFAVLSWTLPGMPLIYTGQEVGLDRAFEFFEKDTAPDFKPNRFTELYTTLNKLKHSRPELAAPPTGGNFKVWKGTPDDILVFSRTKDIYTTVVGVNLGTETIEFDAVNPGVDLSSTLYKNIPHRLAPGEYFIISTE